jgi:membrane-bound lytic murein transglycosylase D
MYKLKAIIWALVFIVCCSFSTVRSTVINERGNIVSPENINTIDSTAILDSINAVNTVFCRSYIKKEESTLVQITPKTEAYFPAIEKSLQQQGLPVELKYLAVVESNLQPAARSKAGAVGMWQLMPETARMLGLIVTNKYDERKLSNKSTDAAVKYLKQLYDKFGDWPLVIAAYNAGAGNVSKAIKRSGSENFWELQNFLPAETREHVKKFIAFHYYFEEKGSVVTMTKNELTKYEQKLA